MKSLRLVILEVDGPAESEIYRDAIAMREGSPMTRARALESLLLAALWKFREPRSQNGNGRLKHMRD